MRLFCLNSTASSRAIDLPRAAALNQGPQNWTDGTKSTGWFAVNILSESVYRRRVYV